MVIINILSVETNERRVLNATVWAMNGRLSLKATVAHLILAGLLTGGAAVLASIFVEQDRAAPQLISTVAQERTSDAGPSTTGSFSACPQQLPEGYTCISDIMEFDELYYIPSVAIDQRFIKGWEEARWMLTAEGSVMSDIRMSYPPGWEADLGGVANDDGYSGSIKLTAKNGEEETLVAWMNERTLSVADLSEETYKTMITENYAGHHLDSWNGSEGLYTRIAQWYGNFTLSQSTGYSPRGTYNFEFLHVRDSDGTVYAFDFYWAERMNDIITPVIFAMIDSLKVSFDEDFKSYNGNVYG